MTKKTKGGSIETVWDVQQKKKKEKKKGENGCKLVEVEHKIKHKENEQDRGR